MNFFIYLTMVSQNPEFVSAVTDMVKNSRIELTIMDTKTVNVEEEKYSFTRNTKTTHETKRQGVVINTYTTSRSRGVEQTTTTTTTTVVPTPKITYAKTWFSEQRITYKIANQDPYHNYENIQKMKIHLLQMMQNLEIHKQMVLPVGTLTNVEKSQLM